MRSWLTVVLVAVAAPAAAQVQVDDEQVDGAPAAAAGAFLPLTRGAEPVSVARTQLGYDGTRGEPTFEASVEVALFRRVSLRGGVSSVDALVAPAPFVGAQVQILSQRAHGIDAAAGVEYDAHGHEGEPQLEVLVALARRFGSLATFANLVYGEELEESQRHGEARLSALAPIGSRVRAGIDARLSLDLDAGRVEDLTVRDVDFALVAGPTASVSVGRFAIYAQAGVSALRFKHEPTAVGALGLAGVGAAF